MFWQLINALRDMTTILREVGQQLHRNGDAMTTLAEAVTAQTAVIQEVVLDDKTKDTTIASLTSQLAASKQAEADALANAATPELIAQIQSNTQALEMAIHVVSNTPTAPAATGGETSSANAGAPA